MANMSSLTAHTGLSQSGSAASPAMTSPRPNCGDRQSGELVITFFVAFPEDLMIQPSSFHPTTRRWRGTRSIAYTPGSIAQVGSVRTPYGETRDGVYRGPRDAPHTGQGIHRIFLLCT